MNLLSDRVAIRVDVQTQEETKVGGFIIAGDTTPKKKNTGEVVFIGTGRLLADGTQIPVSVKEGDKVLFTPFAGSDVSVNGEEFLILRESDIIAVL